MYVNLSTQSAKIVISIVIVVGEDLSSGNTNIGDETVVNNVTLV
jgi:hypothetical protein